MQILIEFVGSGDTAIPLGSPKLSVHLSPLCPVLQEAKLCGLHLLWSLGNSGKRSEGRRQGGQARTLGPQDPSSVWWLCHYLNPQVKITALLGGH